jgi:hypothetical protein
MSSDGDRPSDDPTVVRYALAAAIDRLYGVFERYPLREWTEPCMHCHTREDEQKVHRASLRDLQPDDLSEFAGDSLMTWGDIVDVKHFLPRLFEIVATSGFPNYYPDPEIVLGALGRGGWRAWPTEEQSAVTGFLLAFWRSHLSSYDRMCRAESVLSAIATAVDDLTPYLSIWEEHAGQCAAVHFADLLDYNATGVALGQRLSNPWLEDLPGQERQAREWMIRVTPQLLPRLEAALFSVSEVESREILEAGIAAAREMLARIAGLEQ